MSSLMEGEPQPRRHRRRGRKRSCLAVLVALAVLVGGGLFALGLGYSTLKDRLNPPDDYEGPGHGTVLVQVADGDTSEDIGRTLRRADVVASVEAFTDAATADPKSVGIQVGFYKLQHKMPAKDALDVLVDPDNLVTKTVTVPEGLTVDEIVGILADRTKVTRQQLRRALRKPDALGLPDYAHGDPEGYLFPATYAYPPGADARTLLTLMVDRWRQAAEDAGLEDAASRLGYTPHELMTVASLVEAEASRDADRPKVARVIYNRLEGDATDHLLQIDSTVNYAAGRNLGAVATEEDLKIDSPYNTYLNPGLPPGPIEAPGEASIDAAVHPADGPWNYYVTVNLRTGKTRFAVTYQQFLRAKDELREYCATQSDAC